MTVAVWVNTVEEVLSVVVTMYAVVCAKIVVKAPDVNIQVEKPVVC